MRLIFFRSSRKVPGMKDLIMPSDNYFDFLFFARAPVSGVQTDEAQQTHPLMHKSFRIIISKEATESMSQSLRIMQQDQHFS